jgi:hypothetical protein
MRNAPASPRSSRRRKLSSVRRAARANCRVACLVTTPFLFQSEVTLFFDEAYFSGFLPVSETGAH